MKYSGKSFKDGKLIDMYECEKCNFRTESKVCDNPACKEYTEDLK